MVVTGSHVNRISKIDGGKAHPSIDELEVPVAGNEYAAARCPDIVGRHPDPLVVTRRPVSRPPGVTSVAVFPAAVHPEVLVGRGGTGRSSLQALRRLGQVFDLIVLGRSPEPRRPLMSVGNVLPIAGNPAPVRRRDSVDSGDPNEVFALVVPGPVPGDPDCVCRRFQLRRQFLHGRGRRLGHDESGLRIEVDRFRKRFVDGTTQQVFHVAFLDRLKRPYRRLSGDTTPSRKRDSRRHEQGHEGRFPRSNRHVSLRRKNGAVTHIRSVCRHHEQRACQP